MRIGRGTRTDCFVQLTQADMDAQRLYQVFTASFEPGASTSTRPAVRPNELTFAFSSPPRTDPNVRIAAELELKKVRMRSRLAVDSG